MKDLKLIAEIGGNHEGDFESAKNLVSLALQSGADIIKLQLYSGEGIVNRFVDEKRFLHFQKFELTKPQHEYLAQMVVEAGKEYLASVWEEDMLGKIDQYLQRYKIGSGDLTNKPLIERFAKLGKPIILSTGLAETEEIIQCVNFIRSINRCYNEEGMVSVLQCTAMYPIPDEEANLRAMLKFSEIPNINIGYSDHTKGIEALYLAAVMGAKILEFHFTDTRENKQFRDHFVSLTKQEVLELKQRLLSAERLMGKHKKEPTSTELDSGHVKSFRRAIYLNKNIEKGKIILGEDLVTLRPNHGISAWDVNKILGKKANQNLKAFQVLNEMYFDDAD